MRTLPCLLLLPLLLASGCPKPPPKPSFKIVTNLPTSAPTATGTLPPPPERLAYLKLTPGETKAKPFTVAGVQHEATGELIRLEILEDPAELDDEGLHSKTLADLKGCGASSFLVYVIEVKVDGKRPSDPSVKGTFESLGFEFSYGGEVRYPLMSYVGPAPGRPGAYLYAAALEGVRGDGDWRVKQLLHLAGGAKVELEFSGSVKLPEAG